MRRVLIFAALVAQCDGRAKLYATNRDDGCGAIAQLSLHLLWLAEILGLDAGGLVGSPDYQGHGWQCNRLLLGLGLPRIDEFPVDACVRAPQPRRGILPDAVAAAVRGIAAEGCVLLGPFVNIPTNFFHGTGGVALTQRAATVARDHYIAAQLTTNRLPTPTILRNLRCSSNRTVVALHLRRGDAETVRQYRSRMTPNWWYAEMMKLLPDLLGDSPEFHVFSEGPEDHFADLKSLGAELHLNENELLTIANMISADVMVMATSSFSYVPAVYNSGVVLYQRFWHAKLPHWLDGGALVRQSLAAKKNMTGS